jgi:hypothetical protein
METLRTMFDLGLGGNMVGVLNFLLFLLKKNKKKIERSDFVQSCLD